MSNVPPPPPVVVVPPPSGSHSAVNTVRDSDYGPSKQSEIKLISHSLLFYWWPVPLLAFLMAAFTYIENSRLAVVPPGTHMVSLDDSGKPNTIEMEFPNTYKRGSFIDAMNLTKFNAEQGLKDQPMFRTRISGKSWPGGVFITGLILTILVTNVPLRGLWSFLVIVLVIMFALAFALFDLWDKIFELMGNLHIHINMAGYITLGVITFVIWALAVFIFDRRTYVIFTPGQIKVCEHIGDGVQSYNTNAVSLEKQRDDLFRHYIYGLGSGDLIIKIAGAERRQIMLPNVAFLGLRLGKVEDMLRTVATT